MRTILITGVSGFVGANLAKSLLADADAVLYGIARSSSERLQAIKAGFKEIKPLRLEDREQVFGFVERIKPTVIYHLATYGGFPGQTDPRQMIESNLQATVNLVDAAVAHNASVFINTGSSSEYGLKDQPMKESDICEPVNFYGITKLAATNYCTMVGKASGTRICTLRLFSPYGELEEPSRLYPSIVASLAKNEPPRLSRPHSVRDFIPIETVVKVYGEIVNAPFKPGDIINVASGKQQSLEEFYRGIAAMVGKSHIEPVWGEAPPRANEPQMWQADISKLQTLLPNLYKRG